VVYEEFDKYNKTAVEGRVLNVGVGGLSLGGGLSYLSDLYGFVCDNVVGYEVVLAKGHVVEATLLQYVFMNNANAKLDVIAGYGGDNVRRLWQVARQYDERGMFQSLVPGGQKLPRVAH
jgi:hypothetical protein